MVGRGRRDSSFAGRGPGGAADHSSVRACSVAAGSGRGAFCARRRSRPIPDRGKQEGATARFGPLALEKRVFQSLIPLMPAPLPKKKPIVLSAVNGVAAGGRHERFVLAPDIAISRPKFASFLQASAHAIGLLARRRPSQHLVLPRLGGRGSGRRASPLGWATQIPAEQARNGALIWDRRSGRRADGRRRTGLLRTQAGEGHDDFFLFGLAAP